MNPSVVELNEGNFAREVLGAKRPVLVQFWAGWSEPCKAMAPFLESLADGPGVAIKVGRVSVVHHENLAEEYGVRCVPTVLIFKEGGLQDRIVGRVTKQEVLERLERFK